MTKKQDSKTHQMGTLHKNEVLAGTQIAQKPNLTGTNEWVKETINRIKGCKHSCLYCFAKSNAVKRKFKTINNWEIEELNKKRLPKQFKKRNHRVMFPSTHDLTPSNLKHCLPVIEKLLESDSDVLLVSKPHLDVITTICQRFELRKDQILFRFSIGSSDNKILKFWEPFAPSYQERLDCLKYAFNKGFQTSVSVEPALDLNTSDLVKQLLPYITDAVWIGKPNKLKQRLIQNGFNDETIMKRADELIAGQSDEWIYRLYEEFKNNSKVKWKESIKKVVGIELPEEIGMDI